MKVSHSQKAARKSGKRNGVRVLFPLRSIGLRPAQTAPRGLTPYALARQRRKLEVLSRFNFYLKAGYAMGRAARLAGASPVSLWRWRKLYAQGGA
ncbi:MAG TPA: hypothetical protein VKA67_12695, partial [Verrucomicrobiae bacterium]|nr:hypothetical protein [Verrucomicrobiae bacterium]